MMNNDKPRTSFDWSLYDEGLDVGEAATSFAVNYGETPPSIEVDTRESTVVRKLTATIDPFALGVEHVMLQKGALRAVRSRVEVQDV